MKIQCIHGHVVAPMGNQSYSFDRNVKGDYVADVHEERHIECFLAASYAYRKYEDQPLPIPAAETAPPIDPQRDAAKLVRDALMVAKPPALKTWAVDGKPTVHILAPWPTETGIENDMLEGLPPFMVLDPQMGITITVENGTALYNFAGTDKELGHLYKLADGSTYTEVTPPEAPPSQTTPQLVAIPADWAKLPWNERRELAQKFSATKIMKAEEAAAAITAELAKRAAPAPAQG